jgi:hypothetical protein
MDWVGEVYFRAWSEAQAVAVKEVCASILLTDFGNDIDFIYGWMIFSSIIAPCIRAS